MEMALIWLGLMVAFTVLELSTVSLVAIWFSAGSLAALIVSLITDSLPVQIGAFLLVSIVLLYLLRPFVRKHVNTLKTSTNADRVIGMRCRVVETIDNANGHGIVNAAGRTWTARSNDNSVIEAGQWIDVLAIEGVKVIVKLSAQQD